METTRTATTHFIEPGKFLLMENALGNPDLIQSSVSSDCKVTIVDSENFPLDELEQWPTFRLVSADIKLKNGSGVYYIYICVPTAENTEQTAAIIAYSIVKVNIDGYEIVISEDGSEQTGEHIGSDKCKYYYAGTVSEQGGDPDAITTPSGKGRVINIDLGINPISYSQTLAFISKTMDDGTPHLLYVGNFLDDIVSGTGIGLFPDGRGQFSVLQARKEVQIGNAVLFWDEANNALGLKSNKENSTINFYSFGEISAGGFSDEEGGETGGETGGGAGIDENKLWEILGKEGTQQISKSHLTTALTGYATEQWILEKNYATTSDLDSRIDALVNGAPSAFDTLKEIADVLQGNVDSIGDILTTLGTKADKTITISAGTGLTGGGDLTANRTLSLATVGTDGTYTKVVVDAYGRVTGHSSLAESDIPALSISKITGLQSALDSKLDKTTFNDLFEKVEVSSGKYAIKAKYDLYTEGELSAGGYSQEGSGSGVVGIKVNGQTYKPEEGYITIPNYPTELSWGKITGKPSTLAGYGIQASDLLSTLKTVDGNGSGLDADTLDGTQKSGLFTALSTSSATNLSITIGGTTKSISDLYAHSAYKLENKRTIWGKSFDGTSNVNGQFYIYSSSSSNYGYINQIDETNNTSRLQIGTCYGYNVEKTALTVYNGNVYIGDGTSSYKLYVPGTLYASGAVTFGSTLAVASGITVNGNTVWHEGNDGSGSGLNADLLDNVDGYKFFQCGEYAGASSWSSYMYNKAYYTAGSIPSDGPSGSYGYGTLLVFDSGGSTENGGAITQIYFPHSADYLPRYRTTYQRSGSRFHSWKSLARTTDNVASATKLQTARTIWGQSFDGTDNISGNLNDVGNIVFSSGGSIRNRSNYIGFYTSSSGEKGIKAKSIYLGSDYSSSPSYTLYLDGTSYITGATSIYGATTLGSTLSVSSTSNFTGRTTHKGGVRIQSYIASGTTISLSTHPAFRLTSDSSYGLYGWITGSGDAHLQAGYENNSGFFDIIFNELGGNIGMGTKSPSEKLHVIGNILATGEISAGSSSDARLKTIFGRQDYIKRLMDIGMVVDYEYNELAFTRNVRSIERRRYTGLIYQDVKKVMPQMAGEDADGYGYLNYIHTDYINLIAGALQQTILKQETIEQRVARLEKENAELKNKIAALAA